LRDRVGDRARLLENLLLHEVTIRAEFDRAAIGRHLTHFALRIIAVAIRDTHAVERQLANVALFEEDETLSAARERQRVRREEILAVA
jgi:hypothetical protein